MTVNDDSADVLRVYRVSSWYGRTPMQAHAEATKSTLIRFTFKIAQSNLFIKLITVKTRNKQTNCDDVHEHVVRLRLPTLSVKRSTHSLMFSSASTIPMDSVSTNQRKFSFVVLVAPCGFAARSSVGVGIRLHRNRQW